MKEHDIIYKPIKEANSNADGATGDCDQVKVKPSFIAGFEAYAPEFAYSGGGFRPSYFSELSRLEDANFWFRARNKLIIWALQKYMPHLKSFLEVGCGTGFVLSGIAKSFPEATLKGSEIFIEGLVFAAKRLSDVAFIQMDARKIPFVNELDAIGAFDVIEHIKEDYSVLAQIHKALKPGGIILLTVPQHKWLWSAADEYAYHERRYSASEIHIKLQNAGFRVLRSTSFVTTLLPAMIVSRAIQNQRNSFAPTSELHINPLLNNLFEKMLNLELLGIRLGFSYALGGSRLVVAKKQ